MVTLKSERELNLMRVACRATALILDEMCRMVEPGVSTAELDRVAEEFIRSRGGVPTFKGYRGYPASICASPNSMVVHGIPSRKVTLRDGDLLSVDVGVTLNGLVADSAFTFPVGEVDAEAQRLMEACRRALEAGVAQARAGNRLTDISHAVQQATESAGFSVVRTLVGHGVGRVMHEDPQIPNYGEPGRGPELTIGMTLAIEPMINAGAPEVYLHDDEWSISTSDGSLSAHYEHTIAIVASGPRILTTSPSVDLLEIAAQAARS